MYLDDLESARVLRMIKDNYVTAHHDRAISYVENKQMWRTYVGSPRKEVRRKNRDELIDYLYQYYKTRETSILTVLDVFHRTEDYKLNILNRAMNTIERDRQVFERFYTNEFYNMPITEVTDDIISEYVNRRTKELHLKDRALKDSLQLLGQVFDHAMKKEKLIPNNPVHYVDLQNYYQNCDNTIKTADEKIFTEDEIASIQQEIRARMDAYDEVCYAMLFAIETGVRVGEIPPLRWSDISDKGIHIHRQQRMTRIKGKGRTYTELPYTKDERRHPRGGRYFPVTDVIQEILDELKALQERLGIVSEFIFCDISGEWMIKETYSQRLRRLCRRLGFNITNNHAFRMSLNSNVLIHLGFTVAERAYLLGHSVETNERFYSHMRTEQLQDIKDTLNRGGHARSRIINNGSDQ